jgi:hypothetical protein
MNIKFDIKNIIPNYIEKYIIKKINKKAPDAYGPITESELKFVQNKIINHYKITIDKHIIASIKSAYMKNYIINTHYKLKKSVDVIMSQYPNYQILKLSKQLDLSPLTIIRFIFNKIYNKQLKELLSSNLLSEIDLNQYQIANKSDIYLSIDQHEQIESSINFEKSIENILINYKIKYRTQEDLTKEQMSKDGYVSNTPDFLIDSNLEINSHIVKWIDAKNFYGSNIDFVKNKIKKQIKKYINTYGPGCIIFNYGFNSKLKFNNVLILHI